VIRDEPLKNVMGIKAKIKEIFPIKKIEKNYCLRFVKKILTSPKSIYTYTFHVKKYIGKTNSLNSYYPLSTNLFTQASFIKQMPEFPC